MKRLRRFVEHFDRIVIAGLDKISNPLARVALFVVFGWFGILKIFMESPANPLVEALQQKTLPFISFQTFIICLGLYEMILGILFLIPHLERAAIALLIPHLFTTILPLFLLPNITWQATFVPTLEGQYIIKNVVIIALAFSIAARLRPMGRKWW